MIELVVAENNDEYAGLSLNFQVKPESASPSESEAAPLKLCEALYENAAGFEAGALSAQVGGVFLLIVQVRVATEVPSEKLTVRIFGIPEVS
jgi:hypothetical protein